MIHFYSLHLLAYMPTVASTITPLPLNAAAIELLWQVNLRDIERHQGELADAQVWNWMLIVPSFCCKLNPVSFTWPLEPKNAEIAAV